MLKKIDNVDTVLYDSGYIYTTGIGAEIQNLLYTNTETEAVILRLTVTALEGSIAATDARFDVYAFSGASQINISDFCYVDDAGALQSRAASEALEIGVFYRATTGVGQGSHGYYMLAPTGYITTDFKSGFAVGDTLGYRVEVFSMDSDIDVISSPWYNGV